MMKLSLEWKLLDHKQVALIFDTATWALLQMTADAKGFNTQDMIVEAVVNLLGPVVARPIQD